MSFPDARGPRIPKRHPACPGKRHCRLPGCIHNAPISTISAGASETSVVDLYEPDGNAFTTCVRGGASYQRLDAGSSELGSNGREVDSGMNGIVCTKVLIAQAKIREVLRSIIDRMMRSCY